MSVISVTNRTSWTLHFPMSYLHPTFILPSPMFHDVLLWNQQLQTVSTWPPHLLFYNLHKQYTKFNISSRPSIVCHFNIQNQTLLVQFSTQKVTPVPYFSHWLLEIRTCGVELCSKDVYFATYLIKFWLFLP